MIDLRNYFFIRCFGSSKLLWWVCRRWIFII